MDGAPEGGFPALIPMTEAVAGFHRGLDFARLELTAVEGELLDWLHEVDETGAGRGRPASEESRCFARMVDQLTTMCTLLELSIGHKRDHGDTSIAWIMLEQARQQLAFASITAGAAEGPDREREIRHAVEGLTILLNRDLQPEPAHAGQVVDFGHGHDALPDLRPETPLDLIPVQVLANTAMRAGTVTAGPMPPAHVERMAYGHYLATILEEAMELLGEQARRAEQSVLVRRAGLGVDAALVVWGLTPEPWEVLPPVEGGAGAA